MAKLNLEYEGRKVVGEYLDGLYLQEFQSACHKVLSPWIKDDEIRKGLVKRIARRLGYPMYETEFEKLFFMVWDTESGQICTRRLYECYCEPRFYNLIRFYSIEDLEKEMANHHKRMKDRGLIL